MMDVGQEIRQYAKVGPMLNEKAKRLGVLALTGFVITSTNSRAIRYPTDQSQT